MNYETFLAEVVNRGIKEATVHYSLKGQPRHLRGSIDGFNLCQDKRPDELHWLLIAVNQDLERHTEDKANYWYWRCRVLEVEWVCNVVSGYLRNQGLPPVREGFPTVRGLMSALQILGGIGSRG